MQLQNTAHSSPQLQDLSQVFFMGLKVWVRLGKFLIRLESVDSIQQSPHYNVPVKLTTSEELKLSQVQMVDSKNCKFYTMNLSLILLKKKDFISSGLFSP